MIIGRSDKLRPEQTDDAVNALSLLLQSWANQGVHLWRLENLDVSISAPYVISHTSKYYYCIKKHTAETVNNPNDGDLRNHYWLETETTLPVLAWADGSSYLPINSLPLTTIEAYTIIRVNALDANERTTVELVPRRIFDKLCNTDTGIPTTACHVPGSPGELLLHPSPVSDIVLELTLAKLYKEEHTIGTPEHWLMALKFALAVELGYLNGISMKKLSGIVNKAQFEFRKAKGSPAEMEDKDICFVDPLF